MFQINSGLHLSSPRSIISSIKVRIACGDTAEAILLIFFSFRFQNKSVIMNYFPILTRPSLVSEPSSTSCFFPYRWYSLVLSLETTTVLKPLQADMHSDVNPKNLNCFPKFSFFTIFWTKITVYLLTTWTWNEKHLFPHLFCMKNQ